MIEERVKVRLRVHILNEFLGNTILPQGKYFLAVTGPGLQLGFDDFNKAPRMSVTGWDSTVWIKDLWMMKNSVLTYKYIVIQRYTNEVLHQETITKREMNVGTKPLTIDDKYNRVNFHGENRHAKKTNTRPNAYGLNNKTRDIKKANSPPGNEKTKATVRQYVKQTDEQQPERNHDQSTGDRNDVVKTTRQVQKKTQSSPTASYEIEKYVESNGTQATKPSTLDKNKIMQSITPHLDEEGEKEEVKDISVEYKYSPYMKVAGKLGLVAVTAFGLFKFLTK